MGGHQLDAEALHGDAIFIDAVAPLLHKKQYVGSYVLGGVTCVAPTVGVGSESPSTALKTIGNWLRYIRTNPGVRLVEKARHVEDAKRDGKMGILFHFQGTGPFETDLDLVDAFHAAGVRMVQLTYNRKDYVGDGCEEELDGGLSRFGKDLVRRLNEKPDHRRLFAYWLQDDDGRAVPYHASSCFFPFELCRAVPEQEEYKRRSG